MYCVKLKWHLCITGNERFSLFMNKCIEVLQNLLSLIFTICCCKIFCCAVRLTFCVLHFVQ